MSDERKMTVPRCPACKVSHAYAWRAFPGCENCNPEHRADICVDGAYYRADDETHRAAYAAPAADANATNKADLARGVGTKFDAGKLRYDLLDDAAIEGLVQVLTFGAKKYAPNNWRRMGEWRERYYSALQRHLAAWRRGETHDPETGLHHLAHAMCNVMFMLAMDLGRGIAPDGAGAGGDGGR